MGDVPLMSGVRPTPGPLASFGVLVFRAWAGDWAHASCRSATGAWFFEDVLCGIIRIRSFFKPVVCRRCGQIHRDDRRLSSIRCCQRDVVCRRCGQIHRDDRRLSSIRCCQRDEMIGHEVSFVYNRAGGCPHNSGCCGHGPAHSTTHDLERVLAA